MPSKRWLRGLAAGLLLALSLPPALADDAKTIEINGTRNPELKRYRVMLAGLDAFDEYHALAPKAPALNFRLRVRSGAQEGATLDNLTLRIAGDQASVPVPLAGDGLFSLPRIAALADEDADLVLNQRKGNYRWDADVRSAGVPPNMRRLGDLRLECEVVVAVAKKEIPMWIHATVTTLLLSNHWCGSDKLNWTGRSPRKLRQATLVADGQRLALELGDGGKTYTSPTGNPAYPDDALIELEYADDAP
ncbi:hypothetical protein [Duganella sp. HH105]|uniref:hypothetical protein n=1 Tax=Duganella sp. HH105 TaxID=1781067 RepID=UPI000877B172|nr:hypothetical protein [Duganella sp. HH105]OEZ55120.1 hypothetical protein DUGA6_55170 [Duganella sp. HH105]